jgi:rare lipoprotein A
MIVKRGSILLFSMLFLLFTFSCSSTKNTSAKVFKSKVEASYYADKFNGRKTASGAIFSNSKLTAAHRTLAFGTKVKVTNTVNNKSVEVEINDRGPFKKTREIDLSKKAFMQITENKNNGVLTVNIEILN